jgi:prepilin-type processing-associated H-X9-DG protein
VEFEIDEAFEETKTEAPPRRRKRVTVFMLMTWIFVLSCGLGLFAMLYRAVGSAREAARRAQCTCNLCGIKLALHNYHETYGTLPPAFVADANGRPMHSWRVLILPFMEYQSIYTQYNFAEPWDGPNNIKLLDRMPPNLACPSRSPGNPTNLTSYVAITGPGTMFPGAGSVKFADVTDGMSDTLMIVEVANVDVPWTAPIDLDIRTMSMKVNDPKRPAISSWHPGGANVVFGDARTVFLREGIPEESLRALITIAGGEGSKADEAMHRK